MPTSEHSVYCARVRQQTEQQGVGLQRSSGALCAYAHLPGLDYSGGGAADGDGLELVAKLVYNMLLLNIFDVRFTLSHRAVVPRFPVGVVFAER